jgi:hypothetical protein
MTLENDFRKILDTSKDYTDKAIGDLEAVSQQYVDDAIKADNLAEQIWLQSVETKDDLDAIDVTGQDVGWLILVRDENTIYQRVPGYEEEQDDGATNGFMPYFELVGVDVAVIDQAIDEAIGEHDEDTDAHLDIRQLISDLDGAVVKVAGTQTITGDKTFSGVLKAGTPVASNDVATKGYVDSVALEGTVDLSDYATEQFVLDEVDDLRTEIKEGITDAVDEFSTDNDL